MRDDKDGAILAVETQGVSRNFGGRAVVCDLGLTVPVGSVYGFLGRNGAGKTTTIRMILGLLRPDAGRILVFGIDVGRDRIGVASRIGSLVEAPGLYDRLTGRENLELVRRMRGCGRSEVDRVLEIVDLTGADRRLVGGYSQGLRQRLGIARALLGQPDLLILDEPTNGLDPDGIRELREFLRDLPARTGATIMVSSHLLAEVELVATHVGLIHDGRLLAQGTLASLQSAHRPELEVGLRDSERALLVMKAAGFDAERHGSEHLRVRVKGEPREAAAQVNAWLIGQGFEIFGLRIAGASLEDAYLRLVNAAGGAGEERSGLG